MALICPVSDLRNYNSVLEQVSIIRIIHVLTKTIEHLLILKRLYFSRVTILIISKRIILE